MTKDTLERTVEVSLSSDVLRSLRRAAGEQACLVVIAGPKLGTRVQLGEAPLVVGRGATCGFQVEADSVSRQHARIEYGEGCHYVVDQGSTNGTYLNHVKVGRNVLRDGDYLGVGKVVLKYLASGNIEAAYHEELQRLTRYDGLTGAANKAHFDEELPARLARARAQGQPFTIVLFDLDHFKQVNDTLGHPAGDAVLRHVAGVVGRAIPTGVLFARTGGEEFALLVGDREAAARQLAEQVRRAVQASPCQFEGRPIAVTASLGVAEAQADEGPQAVYARADARLYEAKAQGRNRVV